eukprot:4577983-Pyramimonas_sp.AAC.1
MEGLVTEQITLGTACPSFARAEFLVIVHRRLHRLEAREGWGGRGSRGHQGPRAELSECEGARRAQGGGGGRTSTRAWTYHIWATR